MNLLPAVMTNLHATSIAVVCPRCNTFDIDMAQAQDAAIRRHPVRCWWCERRLGAQTTFHVAGFVSWEAGVVDSEHGSLVDAALELAQSEVEAGSKTWPIHVKHARDKLIR